MVLFFPGSPFLFRLPPVNDQRNTLEGVVKHNYKQQQPQNKSVNHVVVGCWVVRRRWGNFQCRGVLLIWIKVGQGPITLAVGAVEVVGHFFSRLSFSLFLLLVWMTARYRHKYYLKGPLNPIQPNK